MVTALGMARQARRRRVGLGLSQSRVAGSLGVSATQIGRWERGESVPTPAQLRALAEIIGLTAGEVDRWLDEITVAATEPTVSVEILAPPAPVEAPVPWDFPPHQRIAPPALDRGALVGRRDEDLPDGGRGAPGWSPRRRTWREQRRLRRESTAARRRARAEQKQEARRRIEEEARQVRTGPLPMAVPGRLAAQVAAPAGAANTGSVFPVPDTKRSSETVTYHSVEGGGIADDRTTYLVRVVMTIVVLAALAGLLWWALSAFGDGIGSVLDLFRSEDGTTDSIVGALGVIGWG